MAAYLSEAGSRANWMLHSPTMPHRLPAFRDADRSMWYSEFVSVWEGATTMLSPVWTRIPSMFSMLHTIMLLSAPSRMISYSICFHPPRYSSTSTWWVRLLFRPFSTMTSSSRASLATPPPFPPRVNATRMITG